MQIKESDMTSGKSLYAEVRGAFVRKGETFTAWCRENGLNPSNTRLALLGGWDGPKGQAIKKRAIKASGLLDQYEEIQ